MAIDTKSLMGSIAKGAATGKKKVGVAAQKLLASRKVRQAKARVKKIGKVIPKSAMVRGAPVPKDTPKVKPKKVNYNTLTGRLNDLVKRSQGVENVVKGQAKSKWASLKKWRKDREDEQRRRREEEEERRREEDARNGRDGSGKKGRRRSEQRRSNRRHAFVNEGRLLFVVVERRAGRAPRGETAGSRYRRGTREECVREFRVYEQRQK